MYVKYACISNSLEGGPSDVNKNHLSTGREPLTGFWDIYFQLFSYVNVYVYIRFCTAVESHCICCFVTFYHDKFSVCEMFIGNSTWQLCNTVLQDSTSIHFFQSLILGHLGCFQFFTLKM